MRPQHSQNTTYIINVCRVWQQRCEKKEIQVIKVHLLKYSSDTVIRDIYELRYRREKHANYWTPSVELEQVERALVSEHDLSWQKILYQQGSHLLKFLLNATTETCATQDNL